MGVKGLSAIAAYSKLDGQTGSVGDTTAKQIGVGYNFGQIAVGVTRNDTENVGPGSAAALLLLLAEMLNLMSLVSLLLPMTD